MKDDISYQLRIMKEDLKGSWKAYYNRTSDDYEISNPDSKILYEMLMKIANRVDQISLDCEQNNP